MASKARKERRRLEREQREREQLTALLHELEGDESEQAGKEAYSGGTLVETVSYETPVLVERARKEAEQYGQTYEEANWAKLSPMFRERHNRLRQLRHLPPIPPPKIDLYRPPAIRRADPKELEALDREAATAKAQFLHGKGGTVAVPGREGFSINGELEKF